MTSSQTTAASTPSISDQPITGTSLDFFLFFKATYPDEGTQNTTGGSQDLLVTNRSALMRLIDATYELYSSQLMATLEASISKVHILSDLWTSPHRHGILAISARWVDQDYQPRRALLAMPECRYSHSGETQASLIIDTLAKYGIASNVGYHVGDNATSNDTCLSYLSLRLREDYGLTFDPSKRRIRCVAHIINLSLQAFLLASSKEALIAALNAADDTSNDQLFAQFYYTLHDAGQTTRTEEAHQRRRASRRGNRILENFIGWQHIAPLRKVHNIAV
ncbi:putative AC transposase [Fusarium oxysporum f. sp. raphani]|uniref:Putative AC transposase n=1 Tax=Fusarium oxysporum f. sp. raphani TaxID=96318 RepID=A0A8J5NIC8_FUSOX|nr:putative AC transposase [Fusarium oxysporum f. sp. raphani]